MSITKLLGMRKGYVVALTVTEAVTRVAPREPIPGYKALHKRRVHIFKKNTQCKAIFPRVCAVSTFAAASSSPTQKPNLSANQLATATPEPSCVVHRLPLFRVQPLQFFPPRELGRIRFPATPSPP